MAYLGNFAEDATVYVWHSTNAQDGSRIGYSDPLEVADLEVYKDGAATGSTAGVTISNDFDTKTGIHKIEIDMSVDPFYTPNSDYALVLYPDTETVDGQLVAAVLAEWSCQNRYDVVASVTGSVGSVTGAVGSVTGAVGSVTGNVAGSVAAVTGSVGSVLGNVGGSVASVTGNVGGSVDSVVGAVGSVTGNVGGSVASVTGAVGSVTTAVTVGTNNDKTGYSVSTNNDKTGYTIQGTITTFDQLNLNDRPAPVKNVALNNVTFFLVSNGDHITPAPGLTSITCEISQDGGAFAACTNSAVEISDGYYRVNLTAAEMNADLITLRFAHPSADEVGYTLTTQEV